jgi:Tol biopolymer transport system component
MRSRLETGKKRRRPFVLALGVPALLLSGAASAQPIVTRASVSTAGAEGDMASVLAEVSLDGRWIVFESDATNLSAIDTNGLRDVYVRDRTSGTTLLASQSSLGEVGQFLSTNPDVSSIGPFVAFESPSINLVPMDANASTDVFVRDVAGGLTTLVSVDSAGAPGNRNSFNPTISDDGRFVAFDSSSSNLVPLDNNNQQDVFVRDLLALSTFRVSTSSTGAEANNLCGSAAISADGRFVAFTSRATNLVEGDTNQRQDVFVKEIETGLLIRASVTADGTQANQDCFFPSISADGRYVAFQSAANNLVPGDTNVQSDVFVHDRVTGALERVSRPRVPARPRRSAPMGSSSRSRARPRTSSRATSTAPPTCSSATGSAGRRSGPA